MADILRVTTPIVEKNQSVHAKRGIDPTTPFNLQGTQKTGSITRQTPTVRQNVGLPDSDTPTILMNLLKDPGVTVSYLKNISLLEEIYKLLPANNKTMTLEIEQLFQLLLTNPEDIAQELTRQEHASTAFKGEFFDFLRNLSAQNLQRPEMQNAIANLLKATNNLLCRDDILNAVANSLEHLATNLDASRELEPQLRQLAALFRQKDTGEQFPALKEHTLALLDKVENSILFSPKLSKVVSITIYNLSRYNDSETFFGEAVMRLRQMVGGDARRQISAFAESMRTALKTVTTPEGQTAAATQSAAQGQASALATAGGKVPPQQGVFIQGQAGAAVQGQAGTIPMLDAQGRPVTDMGAAATDGKAQLLQDSVKSDPTARKPQASEQNSQAVHSKPRQQAGEQVAAVLTPEQQAAQLRNQTIAQLQRLLRAAATQRQSGGAGSDNEMQTNQSRVMDTLIKMMRQQAGNDALSPTEATKLESILHSLLSSPCNFTPLLHFVVPSFFEEVRAFAEIWINPESDEKDMPEGVDHGIHLLMVVDAESVGRFEAEVFAHDKTVDLKMFCPPEYEQRFGELMPEIIASCRGGAYRIGRVQLEAQEKARSLMDVFKSLPYKRVGVDVRV